MERKAEGRGQSSPIPSSTNSNAPPHLLAVTPASPFPGQLANLLVIWADGGRVETRAEVLRIMVTDCPAHVNMADWRCSDMGKPWRPGKTQSHREHDTALWQRARYNTETAPRDSVLA